jgi:hypothetical protein
MVKQINLNKTYKAKIRPTNETTTRRDHTPSFRGSNASRIISRTRARRSGRSPEEEDMIGRVKGGGSESR